MEEKIAELKSLIGEKLTIEPSYPLIMIHNYRRVIKPRSEIIKRRKIPLPIHEAMGCTDQEFCKKMQISMESLKKFAVPNSHETEYDIFNIAKVPEEENIHQEETQHESATTQ